MQQKTNVVGKLGIGGLHFIVVCMVLYSMPEDKIRTRKKKRKVLPEKILKKEIGADRKSPTAAPVDLLH